MKSTENHPHKIPKSQFSEPASRFRDPAMRAGETLRPAGLFKIAGARRVVREKLLEFGKRFRKRKPCVIENVHCCNASSDQRQTIIYI
jgi:hypothetical protein